jgi:hypothetical protein
MLTIPNPNPQNCAECVLRASRSINGTATMVCMGRVDSPPLDPDWRTARPSWCLLPPMEIVK